MSRKLALALLIIFVLVLAVGLLTRSVLLPQPGSGPSQVAWADEILVIPEDGSAPIIRLVDGARQSVWLYLYMLSDRGIINSLMGAATRGVDVRVMLEKDPFGATNFNDAVRDELGKAGIRVQWSNPTFKLSHQKVLLVDHSRAVIGTFNYVKTAFSTNREFGLVTDDPEVVSDLEALFQADWERKPYVARSPRLVISPDNARTRIVQHIRGATKVLYMEQLSLQDAEVISEIVSAARRGVDVRILMSPPQGKSDPDARGRSLVLSAGGKIRFLDGLDVHAKAVLADDVLLIGSQNLTAQSLDLNREVGITTRDSQAVERFLRTFQTDWSRGR
jgi:cardiolipin synthase